MTTHLLFLVLRCVGRLCLTGVMVIPSVGLGADAQPQAPAELRGEVASLTEYRGGLGKCHLTLKFKDPSLENIMTILRARVTRAVDDTGASLILSEDSGFTGAGVNGGLALAPIRGWYEARPTPLRYVSLQLTNASRRAASITELAGELDLFAPTLNNGGVLVIENALQHPGERVKHPGLERLGVKLVYQTRQTYVAGRPVASASDLIRTSDPAEALFAGPLGEPAPGTSFYLVLQVDDPGKLVASFAFRDPDGHLLPVRDRRMVNSYYGFYFDTRLPADLAVYVYLAIPAAVEKVPFRLTNIPLP